jgi:hypothetical protein
LVYNSSGHNFSGGSFEPISSLDQLGLVVTNYLQAYILIGNQVVDYVQLRAPTIVGGINQALADPNYGPGDTTFYQWSTNNYGNAESIPYGLVNQLMVAENPEFAPAVGGRWSTASTPMGDDSPAAEAAFLRGFFTQSFLYDGTLYTNLELEMQAPYTPSRTVYGNFLLQANDPLVHYMASDLVSASGSLGMWANGYWYNGIWRQSNDPNSQPLPVPPISPVGGRYQPWGSSGQMAALGGVDSNPFNVAYKDPLVYNPDRWNFPTGKVWDLSWIGQVHRGTPWQSIFLKSTNILAAINGFRTWSFWTGNILQANDENSSIEVLSSAPIVDLQLVSFLAATLSTNDYSQQFPVNNPDTNAWAVLLNGLVALTNTALLPISTTPPQFSSIVISSNSIQAQIIAKAIQATRLNTNLFPNQTFGEIGLVFATPELSVRSPFLNTNGGGIGGRSGAASPLNFGITDQAYEMIPSQLLPLLRIDAVAKMLSTNGQMQLEFGGYDGLEYAIQASPDLVNWQDISSNYTAFGTCTVTLPTTTNSPQFYRTRLLP